MYRTQRPFIATLAAAALLLALALPVSGAPEERTYEVTIANLSSGQALTPPVIAAHQGQHDLFKVGKPASLPVIEIAENGKLGPMLAAVGLPGNPAAAAGGAPLVPQRSPLDSMFDQSVTLTVTAPANARFLSWVSMLICTNDGFTGLDSLPLPSDVGASSSALTNGYDAGSELNTQDFADIVPPCQALISGGTGETGTDVSNPGLAEGGVIHHHAGIVARLGDLVPGNHGWTDPVALVVVTRVG